MSTVRKIRYVKSADELRLAAKFDPEFLPSSTRQIRARYETDPELIAAVLPPPLVPGCRPEVGVTISAVKIHMAPGFDIEIGAAVFGVSAVYDGVEGLYMITMPMTTEGAVVGGRETFGEPKKLAQIEFQWAENTVGATVTRHGVSYLELRGRRGPGRTAGRFTEYAYCYKCLPALEKGKGLEFDPLLVRLTWEHALEKVEDVAGEVILRESMFDPVADLPVRRLVSMTYEEGRSRSSGTVLTSVPAADLLPYVHQRYDDITPMLAAMAPTEAAHA
jgi:Acetoacetate decarboxylase (ADC)